MLVLLALMVALAVTTAVAETEKLSLSSPMGTVPYVQNDTAVRGDYTPFEPKEESEHFSGTAMEEDELQQERIAGGAVGAVVSQNLEPLHGITDYSEGEYVPVYGID